MIAAFGVNAAVLPRADAWRGIAGSSVTERDEWLTLLTIQCSIRFQA